MSNRNKFTPGPWKIEPAQFSKKDDKYTGPIIIHGTIGYGVYGEEMVNLPMWNGSPSQNKQQEANARLIASCPELIKALQSAEDLLEFHEGSAKPEFPGAYPTIRMNGEDAAVLLEIVRAALAKALSDPDEEEQPSDNIQFAGRLTIGDGPE